MQRSFFSAGFDSVVLILLQRAPSHAEGRPAGYVGGIDYIDNPSHDLPVMLQGHCSYRQRSFPRASVLSPQPLFFPHYHCSFPSFPNPSLCPPASFFRSVVKVSPFLLFFVFFLHCCICFENWKTRNILEVLYEAKISVKTHSFQAFKFLGFPFFLPKVMTTAAWTAA